MEPVTIMLIVNLVGVGLTFLLNLYQSVKSRHFQSDCGLFSCFYSSEHQDNNEKKTEDKAE